MNYTSISKAPSRADNPMFVTGYSSIEQRNLDTVTKLKFRRVVSSGERPQRDEFQIEITVSKLDKRGNWRNTHAELILDADAVEVLARGSILKFEV